jgi:phosphoribosylamine--glycine ligase
MVYSPNMNVLLLGSGGREHAIALALRKSPFLANLFAAPGNPGIAAVAEIVKLDLSDHAAIATFCRLMGVGLVVVGPEAPLVAGIADDLAEAGIACFGPSRAAARLEGSKAFTKAFCARHEIPTARYAAFADEASARAHVRTLSLPIVIKADGLAAGKGVVIAATLAEAEATIGKMLSGGFGRAGERIVIEEFLGGEEVSFFALCDGTRAVALPTAQDHKRAFDGDKGPNTGGMGAYSPAGFVHARLETQIMREIVEPTLAGMAAEGTPFKGVLFAGLMIGSDGPKLVEFNVRLGDPEAQVVLPRLQEDFLALILACVEETLEPRALRVSSDVALSVVLAAKGYPDNPSIGTEIHGLERAASMPGVTITHAGTKLSGGRLLANGGRVLNVTALGHDVTEARARAYAAVDAIEWDSGFCRRDIGWRATRPT